MTQTNDNAIPFGLIKNAFCSEHYPRLFEGKETHDPAMRLCSQLGRYINSPEHLREIVISALPESYPLTPEQNLLDELGGLIEGGMKLAADNRDIIQSGKGGKKGEEKVVDILIALLESVGAEIFRGPMHKSFISQKLESGALRHLDLRSHAAKLFLRQIYYKSKQVILTEQKLKETLDTLDAKAQFEKQPELIHLRIAGKPGEVLIDLC